MSIQVMSLIMGGNAPAPIHREQKQSVLPIERREAAEAKAEDHHLPGNKKTQAPELKQTVSDIEQISHAFDRRLKFIIDQESKELIVKVIDNETDQVIKVLPPEELQRLHNNIRETMGFLFDRMV